MKGRQDENWEEEVEGKTVILDLRKPKKRVFRDTSVPEQNKLQTSKGERRAEKVLPSRRAQVGASGTCYFGAYSLEETKKKKKD